MAGMNPTFNTHLSLALWLKVYYLQYPPGAKTPYVFPFSDDDTVLNDEVKSKTIAQRILRDVFNNPEFLKAIEFNKEKLKSHSTKKQAAT